MAAGSGGGAAGAVMSERPPEPDTLKAAEGGATDAGDRQRGSGARPTPTSSGLQPGAVWGRYRVRAQIGQGGMGTVFAADDPTLGRKVALKLLRYDDPAQVERFMQEAKTQAQVEHENVCKVYEVGEVGGRPYIAMQLLEGEPLQRAAATLSLEDKVRIMRQVCDGVHAAHRMGLIHRDIKPGNIIVGRGEDGQLKAYVCDFGLAREVGAAGMTVTGLALGTPEYMAPEQAFGDTARLDRRTDVYGLGATLYETLTGHRPYEGTRSAEILVRLLDTDPRPLLTVQPDLPVDLQTIVMKCLEREPARRYDSARALADDLGRFLEGEPIGARPATLSYRLAKKFRKNKALTIVLGASLAALLALGGWAVRNELRARERAALAHRYGLVAKEIEGVMRYGHLLPLHDIRREGDLVRKRMAQIRAEMVDQGDLGVGAARYALGRGHLALQEYEPARRELEEAWRQGYRDPEVAYALAQALGELYRRAATQLHGIDDAGLRAAQQAEIDRRYRDPLREYLAAAGGTQTEAPEYIEGLVAFYEHRFDDAIAQARIAAQRLPWFYEALKLEGDVHETIAVEAQDRGDYALAVAELELAGRAYREALATARSDAALYGAECARRRTLIEISQARGEFREADYRQSLEACASAVEASPDDAQAHIATADVYWRLAEQQAAAGLDPGDSVARELAEAREAVRLLPGDARGHHALGIAYMLAAERAVNSGADPRPMLDPAAANLREAIRLDPGLVWSFNALGLTHVHRAEWELSRGYDVRPTVALAAEVLEEGFRREPGFFKSMKNLAAAYRLQVEYEIENGVDPAASVAKALDAAARARRVNPESPAVFQLEGEVEVLAARWAAARGEDPGPSLRSARQALDGALRINPNMAEAERALAATHRLEAEHAMRNGGDPGAELSAAGAAIDRSLRLNGNSPESFVEFGRLSLARAAFDARRKSSPAAQRRAAQQAFEKALALRPGDHAASVALRDLTAAPRS
jgi:eukaryotic-like serine/threonine-protein kinase